MKPKRGRKKKQQKSLKKHSVEVSEEQISCDLKEKSDEVNIKKEEGTSDGVNIRKEEEKSDEVNIKKEEEKSDGIDIKMEKKVMRLI